MSPDLLEDESDEEHNNEHSCSFRVGRDDFLENEGKIWLTRKKLSGICCGGAIN